MTRRERLERKAEKRREWAEGRNGKADDLRAQDPPGLRNDWAFITQPGHIPERARMNRRDDKAHEHHAMAAHHVGKAEGIERQLDHSIFSDDEDAIAKLEARVMERQCQRAFNNGVNRIIRSKPKNEVTAAKLVALMALDMSETTARALFTPDFGGRVGIPSYVNQNLGGNIAGDKKRIETIKRRAQQSQKAENAGGVLVERHTGSAEGYATITFSEKPERSVLVTLKAAGFRWNGSSWFGQTANIPEGL